MIAVVDGVFTNLQMKFWKKGINRSTDNFVSGVLDKEGEGWHLSLIHISEPTRPY